MKYRTLEEREGIKKNPTHSYHNMNRVIINKGTAVGPPFRFKDELDGVSKESWEAAERLLKSIALDQARSQVNKEFKKAFIYGTAGELK